MNKNKMIYMHSKRWKILLYITDVLLLIILIVSFIDAINRDHSEFSLFIVLPGIIFLTIHLIYVGRVKLILTDNYIESSFIKNKSKKIFFNEVEKIIINRKYLRLKGRNCKISITGEYEGVEKLISLVVKKIEHLPNLKIQGDKKYFKS